MPILRAGLQGRVPEGRSAAVETQAAYENGPVYPVNF